VSSVETAGKEASSEASFHVKIGNDINTGEKFGLTRAQKETHTHIIGSSGSGKSKLIEHLIRQDMRNPDCGVCLIDPHGTLYDELVMYASHNHPRLAKRIVLFNPLKDVDHVMGFNPVSSDLGKMDYYLDTLIGSCLKAWGQNNPDQTPRIQRWLNNIFHTLMVNDLTLLEAIPLISTRHNDGARDKLLQKVNDEGIIQDWETYENLNATQRQNVMEGASNRLGKFLRSEAIRLIIGQQNHTLDMQECMEEGKIVLVNLYGGDKISYDNCKLIGSLLVSDIFNSAQLRDPQKKLKPFYVYIDEFAEFISRDIARALDQTRKRKVFMTLAHQHLSQLKEEDEHLYGSILTNCKTKIVFGGLSHKDSELMTHEVHTGFHDLKSLKHEQYRIRERHIEETREVYSRNTSETRGRSEGETFTEGESSGESQSTSTGKTFGKSQTKGTSSPRTKGKSKGITQSITSGIVKGVVQGISEAVSSGTQRGKGSSNTLSHSEGESSSEGQNRSTSHNESQSRSSSESSGENWSNTDGENWGNTSSSSTTHGDQRGNSMGQHGSYVMNQGSSSSHTSGYSNTNGGSRSNSRGGNRSSSNSESSTQGKGWSEGESSSKGRSRSQGRSEGFSETESSNQSQTRGSSQSQSQSQNEGQSLGRSQNVSNSRSQGKTDSKTQSESQTVSQSQGKTQTSSSTRGHSKGTSESHTKGESIATVPFLRPEEVEELASVSFWSLNELTHMAQGQLKNLEIAEAFIKIGSDAPVHCKIDNVVSTSPDKYRTEARLESFRNKVIASHPQYYSQANEVRTEYQTRQRVRLGNTLNFETPDLLLENQVESENGFT